MESFGNASRVFVPSLHPARKEKADTNIQRIFRRSRQDAAFPCWVTCPPSPRPDPTPWCEASAWGVPAAANTRRCVRPSVGPPANDPHHLDAFRNVQALQHKRIHVHALHRWKSEGSDRGLQGLLLTRSRNPSERPWAERARAPPDLRRKLRIGA